MVDSFTAEFCMGLSRLILFMRVISSGMCVIKEKSLHATICRSTVRHVRIHGYACIYVAWTMDQLLFETKFLQEIFAKTGYFNAVCVLVYLDLIFCYYVSTYWDIHSNIYHWKKLDQFTNQQKWCKRLNDIILCCFFMLSLDVISMCECRYFAACFATRNILSINKCYCVLFAVFLQKCAE